MDQRIAVLGVHAQSVPNLEAAVYRFQFKVLQGSRERRDQAENNQKDQGITPGQSANWNAVPRHTCVIGAV